VVRAMMLVRCNMLAKAIQAYAHWLPKPWWICSTPGLPFGAREGIAHASGDLAPLAHIATVMTRDLEEGDGGYSGKATYQGERWMGQKLWRRDLPAGAGSERGPGAFERMDFMTACGALAVHDENLLRHAQIAASLSLEALLGSAARSRSARRQQPAWPAGNCRKPAAPCRAR
jgi:histidine ammonia-lyase